MTHSNELAADRSRVSYGQMRAVTRAARDMQRAQRDSDLDALYAAEATINAFVERVVTCVPDDFWHEDAPKEARAMGAGWLDWVRADKAAEVVGAATGVEPVEKKA